jgi:Fic family protein
MELLPANLLNITNAISALKTHEMERMGVFPNIFSSLETIAKVQSVKSSNEIEGIITSDERIHAIVAKSSAPLNHSEMEIAGYRDALDAIHRGHDTLDARESDILALHGIMLSYTPEGGGTYKERDNAIIEIDDTGRRSIRFLPTSAIDTPEAMEQLSLAYMDASNNSNINKLLLIPCFVLDFLCVHPFSDGNGRMSRLLSLLLLYKSGFTAGKYISFEEQINNRKGMYYDALKRSSEGWQMNENDYIPFIGDFLQTLLMCYKELDNRFASLRSGKVTKKRRIEEAVLNSLLPISKMEIAHILSDVSPTTIEAVLATLVKSGKVTKIGAARSTRYLRK